MPSLASLLALHVAAGAVALVAFWLAALLRKGGRGHRFAGRVHLLSMAAVVLSGVPLAVHQAWLGRTVAAAFLGYLLVLVGSGLWLAWRAIRDRTAPRRFAGPVYVVLAWANLGAGLAVLLLGLRHGQALLVGFSLVGVYVGQDMLRARARIGAHPQWWLRQHYGALLGSGAAAHIAFLAIGLPRWLPSMQGPALQHAAWFGPLLVAAVARHLLDRRHRRGAAAADSLVATHPPPS